MIVNQVKLCSLQLQQLTNTEIITTAAVHTHRYVGETVATYVLCIVCMCVHDAVMEFAVVMIAVSPLDPSTRSSKVMISDSAALSLGGMRLCMPIIIIRIYIALSKTGVTK